MYTYVDYINVLILKRVGENFLLLFSKKKMGEFRYFPKNQATEEYLKIEIIILLITVPYGSPYWDYFFISKLSLGLLNHHNNFLKDKRSFLGRKH